MPENPVATQDQRDIEDLTLRLLARPELVRAKEIATLLWRNAVAWPSREQMDRFDNMIDEYTFHYAIRAANSDADHPRIARFMVPRHTWFGREIPGSRWAGDSPDFVYRILPLDPVARYEIHGRPAGNGEPPTVNYQLLGTRASPLPMGLLDSLDMAYEADGSFVITLGPDAPEGRPNHIQMRPGADHLMIRDALGDWVAQKPNHLEIRRIDPPSRAPLEEDELARRAAQSVLDMVYYAFYTTQSGSGQAPNDIRPPQSSGAFGGMPTQWGCKGNLDLAEDEAIVVTANAAGALFRNVVLCDRFMMSIDYWNRTTSLNMDQMTPDEDGRFTYVVSHRDPGVANWLDTGGLRQTIFGQRWQSIPRGYTGEQPRMTTRIVKLDDLDKALPGGAARIDPAGRAAQIVARQAGFKLRFLEG